MVDFCGFMGMVGFGGFVGNRRLGLWGMVGFGGSFVQSGVLIRREQRLNC
jgi:hypothetical protein